MSGTRVAHCLSDVLFVMGPPESVTMVNGTEFQSRAMDAWAHENNVRLDFIRPGMPADNG